MSTAEILDAALSLSARQRGRLISALIQSLEHGSDSPFENADDSELVRRIDTSKPNLKNRSSPAVTRRVLEGLRKRTR